MQYVFQAAVFLFCGLVFACFLIPVSKAQETDFSKFKHSNPMHTRLPCLVCHKRDDNSPIPAYSGHIPCASCHVNQFADNKNPICTICHTTTGVKQFPPLTSFNARFDHAQHLQQTNCATCHKLSRGGVGFSIPSGANAHVSCFQCHSASSSNTMSSCGTCHQPGSPSRTSEWAKAYTTSFTHLRHLQSMNCASCHTVKAGLGRGNQVTAPLTSMHFAPKNTPSCASCHNNKRTFGGDDFSDCKRCHRGNSFAFR
ncbi:MAG: cytochrome c3 family protein [Actinomycetota bacterium]